MLYTALEQNGITNDNNIKSLKERLEDLLNTSEGVYSAGKVIRLIVAGSDGEIDVAFFRSEEAAKRYLEKYYKGATLVTNTTYLALDSLDPNMPPNKYSLSEMDVLTTTKPDESNQTEYIGDEVVTAFVDNNPKEAQPFQRLLNQQIAIGVWINSEEAADFYKKLNPNITIRDNSIPGNAATTYNPVKQNEVYLQHRPIVE
jgi:hypothetical protein